jgi:glutathione S-transferase
VGHRDGPSPSARLYYSPGAGALASHITIREPSPVELFKVVVPPPTGSLAQPRKTESGDDYHEINPKGYVPYLTIDSGTHLSEGEGCRTE